MLGIFSLGEELVKPRSVRKRICNKIACPLEKHIKVSVQTNIRTTTRLRRTIPKKIQKKGEDFQLLVRHKLHVKSRRSCCYECNLGQEPRSYRSFSFENPSNIIMLIRVCRCLPDCGALCHERSQVKKLLPSNE